MRQTLSASRALFYLVHSRARFADEETIEG